MTVKPAEERPCRTCGRSFAPRRRSHLYCSPGCRPSAAHNYGGGQYEPAVQGEGTADRAEIVRLLWVAARNGSAVAMKTLLEEDGRDNGTKPDTPSAIDELARRRS
jgi:hypothetical protein